MNRLPVWFERAENLAIAAAVVVVFVHVHFAWWWLPALFLAFGLVWAFHIAGDRVLGYGLKFVSGFNDTHLGTIGRQPGCPRCCPPPWRSSFAPTPR